VDSLPISAPDRASSESLQDKVSDLFVLWRLPLYRYLLAGVGGAAEAEDLTQECFFRIFRYLQEGNQLTDPRLWLFLVARNLVLDRNKSSRVLREVSPPSWGEIADCYSDPSLSAEQKLIEREGYETVQNAMQELSHQQREVLSLKAEGLGYKEIGEIMSLTTFAVAALVRRGVAKIRTKMP
jgi:RNA polymerase sigma-70 factor (ECF subfamily)